MDVLIAFCAQYVIFLSPAALLAYFFFTAQRRRLFAVAALSLALSYALGKLAGALWYDPRPFTEGVVALFSHVADNGFPSDHMLFGAAVASVAFIFNRPLGLVLWVLALLVGAARVLAGVHHWADIAGAAVVALISVFIVNFFVSRFFSNPA